MQIIDVNNDLQINLIESKVHIETQPAEEIAVNNLSSEAQGSNPSHYLLLLSAFFLSDLI